MPRTLENWGSLFIAWFNRFSLEFGSDAQRQPAPTIASPTGYDPLSDSPLQQIWVEGGYRGLADPNFQPSILDFSSALGLGGGGSGERALLGESPLAPDRTSLTTFVLTERVTINTAADILAYAHYCSQGTALDRRLITDEVLFDLIMKCDEIAKQKNLGIPDIQSYILDTNYQDFEVCNFSTPSYFVRNNHTFEELDGYGEPGQDSGFAILNPEYNYFVREYEEGISNPDLPEAVLPNMYIYSLLQKEGDLEVDRGATLGWQQGRNQRNFEEVQNNYDKLVRMDEVVEGVIPVLAGEPGFLNTTDQYQQQFSRYLQSYATAVSESIIVLDTDMMSDLAQQYYNLYTPAAEMSIYDQLNYKKNQFPMYIESWIPTLPTGRISQLIQRLEISSVSINSLNTTPSSVVPYRCVSDAFCSVEDVVDVDTDAQDRSEEYESSYIRRMSPRFLEMDQVRLEGQNLTMYNAQDWVEGMLEEVAGSPLGIPSGAEVMPDRCLELQERLSLHTLQNAIDVEAQKNIISYEDYLMGDSSAQNPETIIYKLVKKQVSDNSILQTYFFPNTEKESVIKFVDTQVKYDKEYRYEVYGFALVYGTKFRFRTISSRTEAGSIMSEGIDGQPMSQSDEFTSPYAHCNVQSLPNPKIIEYPIYTQAWRNAMRNSSQTIPWVTAGSSLHDVRLLDRPPMLPNFEVVPYRNEPNTILILSSNGMGQMLRQNAVKYVAKNDDERSRMLLLGRYQNKFEYYDLASPFLEYKSEGAQEIAAIEIYRTTGLPSVISSMDDIFGIFGEPHRVMEFNIDNNDSIVNTESFDFCDDLQSNIKYFYMARSLDYHGNYSNPSPIYEVELVYNSGVYYPVIKLYTPREIDTGIYAKRLARFMKAEAADIQTMVAVTQEGGATRMTKGFIPESDLKVKNNHFIIRLTSIDTGRKVDFKLQFDEKTNRDDQ